MHLSMTDGSLVMCSTAVIQLDQAGYPLWDYLDANLEAQFDLPLSLIII
jgi:hypothetical protein